MTKNLFSNLTEVDDRTFRRSVKGFRSTCAPTLSARLASDPEQSGTTKFPSDLGQVILVPVDFTDVSHKALTNAVLLARDINCHVVLVHVIDRIYGEGFLDSVRKKKVRAATRRQALRRLDEMAQFEGAREVTIKAVVQHGVPEYEIMRTAERLNAKMLVMGRRARNALSRRIFGSVTGAVIDSSNRPVLVINEPAEAGEMESKRTE